ncbi:hypothetical protein CRE_16221 [Caenorhabditis remanei]|uniref:DUF281 domain-containing protein n=1 Tax=Caenorhabditis remanei TaxID=31234 RepID=E3MSM8_CAERE|nr:hypothetical protein CRE_16221 [Caenorhabditis remanei]
MNPRLIVLTLLTLSLVEMCVRMIPPEEVSISTTASSLPTDKPGEVTTEGTATSSETDSPSTEVPVTDTPVTDTPVTDTPVTDTPVTDEPVTEDPTDQCTECDIGAIMRDSIPDVQFEFQDTTEAGQCTTNKVTCKRTDTMTCTDNKMLATTPTGQVSITDSTTTTEASATLTCANDGTYSPGTTENTVNGCKTATITCKRDDGQICTSVAVQVPSPAGFIEIASAMNTALATAELTCSADGKYISEGVEITELFCRFNTCAPPPPSCKTCSKAGIISIAAPAPPNVDYIYELTSLPDAACVEARIGCKTTDDRICKRIEMRVICMGLGFRFIFSMNTASWSDTFQCSSDGTFSYSGLFLYGPGVPLHFFYEHSVLERYIPMQ